MLQRPQSIILYASQIAACIGCNRHKKPAEAMEAMWERISPDSYRNALQRTGSTTDMDRVHSLAENVDTVKSIIEESNQTCVHSQDVAVRYDAASRAIFKLPNLDSEDKKVIDSTVKRNLYTNYGTASEHRALVKVRETLGINARPDDTFYKAHVADVDGVALWVGGKIDAITEERLVIEIKNRIRRLFYKVPFYEVVQLQTYLHLLDVSRGAIVECLTTPSDTKINIVPIRRDKDLWAETIVPKMKAYVRVLVDLLTNKEFQDAYLLSTKKAAFVQTRINQYAH